MNELNKIRGYMIPITSTDKPTQSLSGVKYFLLGPENKFFITSNLALIQFLSSQSETIEKLYENANKYLTKLCFLDKIVISGISDFGQPEFLPFYNQKHFTANIKALPVKKAPIDQTPSETVKEQTFMIFALDDELIISLHAFFTSYSEFFKSQKKQSEFFGTKLELFNHEEDQNSLETLNYKKHLENYKMKMRLLIQKMELDEKEIREGVAVVAREIADEEQLAEGDQNSNLVKLNNGSLYAGTFKGNKPDGSGKEFLPDHSSYVGEFKNGFWHGSGYLVDSENYICYGEFYEGRVVGI